MPIFRYHFSPPLAALNFAQNLGNPQPRLANKKGAILETHGLPRIPLEIWECPSPHFVSYVAVCAGGANVAGLAPEGGIFSAIVRMCNFTVWAGGPHVAGSAPTGGIFSAIARMCKCAK